MYRRARLLLSPSLVRHHRAAARGGVEHVIPKTPSATVGYDMIMQRAANIVLSSTERQVPFKLLHVFPESTFLEHLGKASNVHLTGLSTASSLKRQFRFRTRYQSIEYLPTFDGVQELSLPRHHFSVVVHCAPIWRSPNESEVPSHKCFLSPSLVPIAELVRVVQHRGYVVVGYPKSLWESQGILEQLKMLEKQDESSGRAKGKLMMVAEFPLHVKDIKPFQSLSALAEDEDEDQGTNEKNINVLEAEEAEDVLEFDEQTTTLNVTIPDERYLDASRAASLQALSALNEEDRQCISYMLAIVRMT